MIWIFDYLLLALNPHALFRPSWATHFFSAARKSKQKVPPRVTSHHVKNTWWFHRHSQFMRAAPELTNQKADSLRHPHRKPPKISLPPQLAPWGRKSKMLLTRYRENSNTITTTSCYCERSTQPLLTYLPFAVCRALIPCRGNLPWTAN